MIVAVIVVAVKCLSTLATADCCSRISLAALACRIMNMEAAAWLHNVVSKANFSMAIGEISQLIPKNLIMSRSFRTHNTCQLINHEVGFSRMWVVSWYFKIGSLNAKRLRFLKIILLYERFSSTQK